MSRVIVRMWVVWCCAVVLGAGWTVVQACNPSTKVKFSPPIDSSFVGLLLNIIRKQPASCHDLEVDVLMKCLPDLGVKEGCCDPSCKDVLSTISATCVADFARVVCDEGGKKGIEAIEILNNLLQRCDDRYAELKCPAGPAGKPSDEEAVECLDSGTRYMNTPKARKAAKRVLFDPPVDTGYVAHLFEVQIPASCGDFYSAQFLKCLEDLKYKEGCCARSCNTMFTEINATCLADFAQATCNKWKKEGKKSIEILDNLARRCDDDYIPFSC